MPVNGGYYYGDPEKARLARQKAESSRTRKWKAMQDAMKAKRTTPTSEPRREP